MRALPSLFLAGCVHLAGPPATPLDLPRDHGPHREAQTEWWYLQGVLVDAEGYERSVFLSSVVHDPRADRVLGLPVLAWGRRVLLLTAGLADLESDAVLSDRSIARPLPGLAQHLESTGERFDLRAGAWRTQGKEGHFTWDVPVRGGRLALRVEPSGPPLPALPAEGDGSAPGRLRLGTSDFSYYALTRVGLDGWLEGPDGPVHLTGEGWLDHQWGYVYAHEYGGWSWYALTLEDGTDLLISRVEPRAAGIPPVFVGSLRPPGGDARPTGLISIEVRRWSDPVGGIAYPMEVALDLPAEDLSVVVCSRSTAAVWRMVPVPIWEAPVTVEGVWAGRAVGGTGFAEHLRRGDPPARRIFHSGRPVR
jgi:predicted secreted hydrolase